MTIIEQIIYALVVVFTIIGVIATYYFLVHQKKSSRELLKETRKHNGVSREILNEAKKRKKLMRKQLGRDEEAVQKLDGQIELKKKELELAEKEYEMKEKELELKRELAQLEDDRERERLQLERDKLEYERSKATSIDEIESIQIDDHNPIYVDEIVETEEDEELADDIDESEEPEDRFEDEEEAYEKVLNRLVKRWNKSKIVWINPRDERNYSYKRYYPTIVVKDGNYVEFICEFTVKDYVDGDDLNWWEDMAHHIDRPFYLFVPLNIVEEIYDTLRKRKMKRFINLWVWFKDGKKIKLIKYRR